MEACTIGIRDWAAFIREMSGIERNIRRADDFFGLCYRTRWRGMKVEDVLWWMAVCSDNEISIADDTVVFNMRMPDKPVPTAFGRLDLDAVDVSLINLIANPEEYHRKAVRTVGVMACPFVGSARLYVTKDDYDHGVYLNNIEIVIDYTVVETDDHTLHAFKGKHVMVEGIFDADSERKRLGMSGVILGVHRLAPWGE